MHSLFYLALGAVPFVAYMLLSNSEKGDLRKIPGPKSKPFFGNIFDFSSDPVGDLGDHNKAQVLRVIEWIRKTYGDVSKYYYFSECVVLLSDPHWIEHVFNKNSKNYTKERDVFLTEIVGNGLLVSQGEFWRKQRRTMTPAFGHKSLKQYYPSFVETTRVLLKKWQRLLSESNQKSVEIDVREETTKVTLDIISLAAFSYPLNSIEDPLARLPKAITTVLHESEVRVFQLIPFWKLPFWPSTRRFRTSLNILKDEVRNIILNKRKQLEQESLEHAVEYSEENSDSLDLMSKLLVNRDPETKEEFTDEQLVDEGMSILLAGHETTANGTAFTLFLLARHPEAMQKVVEEIHQVLGDRDEPQFEDFNQLKYLDLVIKESMRMYPPASQLANRYTVEDDTIANYRIPSGTFIEVWPWLMHRHPQYWTNPDEFDPLRFERGEPFHRYAYLPFSLGPRSCIGSQFAILEIKVIIVMILKQFTLSLLGGDIATELVVTLRPEKFILEIENRSSQST